MCPSLHLTLIARTILPTTTFWLYFALLLKTASLSTSTGLPALANQLVELTGKSKEVFGPNDAAKQDVEVWLSKVDADQVGDLQVSNLSHWGAFLLPFPDPD